MQKLVPNDPETTSADLVSENVEQLRSLFPEAFEDGKIDFEVLKQLLGGSVDDREERYGLNWHGKRKARQLALTPSTGTLRPCPNDSVDWDSTQNLMIEGDNLEVLKLLEKSYAGQVKLIYIDPPYNTGSDFVYPDDFKDNIRNYLEISGQVEGGQKISSNTEASGRFHTDWLNMIYPRLKVARNLLREDGVICISIDDCEQQNLRLITNEVFGEENLIEAMVWKRRYGGGAKEKHIVSIHEYVLVYAREKAALGELFIDLSREQVERYYKLKDDKFETQGPYRLQPLEPANSMADRPNLRFSIIAPDGTKLWPRRQWLWGRERFQQALENEELAFAKKDDAWTVNRKQYLRDPEGAERLTKQASIIDGIYGQQGSSEVDALFGEPSLFLFPKPTGLITLLLQLFAREGIVMDFFAGSGTTGHATWIQNSSDSGSRNFILVQLPEPLSPENKDQRSAAEFCSTLGKPLNIAELTKERLRRAGSKIKSDNPLFVGDVGFRVFKLDTSNLAPWDTESKDLDQSLLAAVTNIKGDRTEADILNELLLKLGLELGVPVEEREIAGKTVHSIGSGVLMVCLAAKIDRSEVETLALGIVAWHEELAPAAVSSMVFLDSAFADDVSKANMTAILSQHGLLKVRSL